MSDDTKPREWWIDSKRIFGQLILEAFGPEIPDGGRVDVVEREALTRAEVEIEKLNDHVLGVDKALINRVQELDILREQMAPLVSALESMILEAKDQMGMYVTFYKQQPYDTAIMLQIYIKDSIDRITQSEEALKKFKGITK